MRRIQPAHSQAVYGYWTTLPVESRPRFYLHGLSLGSSGSEESTEFLMILGDLIHFRRQRDILRERPVMPPYRWPTVPVTLRSERNAKA